MSDPRHPIFDSFMKPLVDRTIAILRARGILPQEIELPDVGPGGRTIRVRLPEDFKVEDQTILPLAEPGAWAPEPVFVEFSPLFVFGRPTSLEFHEPNDPGNFDPIKTYGRPVGEDMLRDATELLAQSRDGVPPLPKPSYHRHAYEITGLKPARFSYCELCGRVPTEILGKTYG